MTIYQDHFDTPLGKMEITADNKSIKSINFVESVSAKQPNKFTDLGKQQLLEYYSGERQEFDLPLHADGTQFQQSVWRALNKVAYADTCSYGDIARLIKNPKAVRAVGSANGKNPMTIVVPCHRVIGSDGTLTGYASGVKRKAWLLKHEAMCK